MVGTFDEIVNNYLSDDDKEMYANHFYTLLKDGVHKDYDKNRRFASGEIIASDFDYITKPIVKEYEENGSIQRIKLNLPAKIKFIPILEPGIRVLLSDLNNRMAAMAFKAYSTSSSVADENQNRMLDDLKLALEVQIKNKVTAFQQQKQLIQQQGQAIQQENPQMAEQIMPMLSQLDTILSRQIGLTNKELEDIEKFYKYTFKDLVEIDTEHILKWHIEDQELKILFERGFKEKLINGSDAEIYHVYVDENKVKYRVVYPERLQYNSIEDVIFIKDLPYCKETFSMSILDAKKFFHHKGYEIDDHTTEYGGKESQFTVNPNGEFVNREFSQLDNEATDVEKLFFKVNRKVGNKVIQDLYISYFIHENLICTELEKDVIRNVEESAIVYLPYVGFTRQSKHQGDGLTDKTKDIQELINILWYKKQLLIVTSGIRGMVYDISQKPADMSMSEVIYYTALGIAPVESVNKVSGKPKNGAFNQFGTYDMGLGNSVAVIDASIESLKSLASELTGVNAIRQGTVRPTDQVGSLNLAYNQSASSSEYYFATHEKLVEQVLGFGATLGTNIYYNKGASFTYRNKDIVEKISIPKKRYKGNCKISVESGAKNVKNLSALREAMQMRVSRSPGLDELSAYTKILGSDSIKEAEMILLDFAELAEKKGAMSQQQQQQAQQQFQQQQSQLDQQLEQMRGQIQAQLKEIDSKTKIQIAQIQDSTKRYEIESMSKVSSENNVRTNEVKKYDIDMETAVEMEYLEKEKNELNIEAQLNTVQMFINDNSRRLELSAKSKERVKD